MNRYDVMLQHFETGEFCGRSVVAVDIATAIAVAQRNAGGGAWHCVRVGVSS